MEELCLVLSLCIWSLMLQLVSTKKLITVKQSALFLFVAKTVLSSLHVLIWFFL